MHRLSTKSLLWMASVKVVTLPYQIRLCSIPLCCLLMRILQIVNPIFQSAKFYWSSGILGYCKKQNFVKAGALGGKLLLYH